MMLVEDAISTTSKDFNLVCRFSEGRINANLLKEIAADLNETEIISIIFLMSNKNTNILEVIKILDVDYFMKFIQLSYEINWEEKLLESLLIIGNINVIKRLGYTDNEIKAMKNRFVISEHNVTTNLNRIIKSLYFLCEYLNKNEVKKLIKDVNKNLNIPIEVNEDKLWLERYILHWVQQKYITIDEDNYNLNNLLKNLKNIGCICNLPFNFESWKSTNQNQQDSSLITENVNSLQPMSYNNDNNEIDENSMVSWAKEHKKLCIIINEVNFKDGGKYVARKGSDKDVIKLEKTFKGCSFEVEKHRNLTEKEMLSLLDSLNEHAYNEYGSIFMCILSHGYEGHVIFSDNESIPIKTIEEKFCCQNLQNVFKMVILQSCQGKELGIVNKKLIEKIIDNKGELVTDGPKCPLYHMHFGLFQATILNYTAMRHESEGSWFIQDACEELQMSTPIKVTDWTSKVTTRLSSRKADTKNKDKCIVQVPRFSSTISIDYVIPRYNEKTIDKNSFSK